MLQRGNEQEPSLKDIIDFFKEKIVSVNDHAIAYF